MAKTRAQANEKRPKRRISPRDALEHLRGADPVLARVIRAVGPFTLKRAKAGTHFDHVVRAIIYQQLSGKAAATIHARVKGVFGGADPTAAQILAAADETLRAAGLSRQKLGYLKDLAARVANGEVPFDTLEQLEDEAIIEALTRVKGVGPWTAQMFLMFRLGRPNVLPLVDLGINKAIMNEYKLRKMPKPKDVERIGAAWAPHATVACWYLWRSLELPRSKAEAKTKARTKARTKA